MAEKLIVARHAGAVEWLNAHGVSGEVVPHVSDPSILEGRIVVGILPLNLAAKAAEVWSVDLPNLPAELRGKELSPIQMDECGAVLRKYRVTLIEE